MQYPSQLSLWPQESRLSGMLWGDSCFAAGGCVSRNPTTHRFFPVGDLGATRIPVLKMRRDHAMPVRWDQTTADSGRSWRHLRPLVRAVLGPRRMSAFLGPPILPTQALGSDSPTSGASALANRFSAFPQMSAPATTRRTGGAPCPSASGCSILASASIDASVRACHMRSRSSGRTR